MDEGELHTTLLGGQGGEFGSVRGYGYGSKRKENQGPQILGNIFPVSDRVFGVLFFFDPLRSYIELGWPLQAL